MPTKKNETSRIERHRRVTLQDIADVVGVKKMVVSNALNGTRSVAPATREKVLRIAKEMNYVPNFAARALTTGRTGLIAILSGPLNQPYYADMVHLLEQHIHVDGFNLMLMRTPSEVKELVNATGNIAVDGAIAVDMLGLVSQFGSTSSIPCVSIATIKRGLVDHVLIDLSGGVEEALGLMDAAGRTRIAYLVTAPIMEQEPEVRVRAYLATMAKMARTPEIINVSAEEPSLVESNFKSYIEAKGCP
ncbi:MAG: LacI family transcriptional regulator, partial [Cytophagaceae bacterium]